MQQASFKDISTRSFQENIFGYGFDNANPNITTPNGWETHFVIGQRF